MDGDQSHFTKVAKKSQPKKITSFFKRQSSDITNDANQENKRSKVSMGEHEHHNEPNEHPTETQRPNNVEVNPNSLERDPGKRQPICLLKMFDATRVVLEGIVDDSSSYSQRADAAEAYNYLTSFEFVFILHLMKELMGRTNILSQELQKKSQDIGNAIDLVSATKVSLDNFRNKGWEHFMKQVQDFTTNHKIDMPDFSALYKCGRYRPRQKDNHVTFEHFYRVDIFICALDKQLHELAFRFNNNATELLTLSSALIPRKKSEVINIDQVCSLVEKYYPIDFTEQEMIRLRYELELFNIEKSSNQQLSSISTVSELCRFLIKSKKSEAYGLIERLLRLILTLSVSTATTERAFSAMKICKNRLRNKMSDDFLASNLVVNIEREIAQVFDSESVIDEFKNLKGRRAEL